MLCWKASTHKRDARRAKYVADLDEVSHLYFDVSVVFCRDVLSLGEKVVEIWRQTIGVSDRSNTRRRQQTDQDRHCICSILVTLVKQRIESLIVYKSDDVQYQAEGTGVKPCGSTSIGY